MAVSRLPRLRIVTAASGRLARRLHRPSGGPPLLPDRDQPDALETSEKKYLKGSSVTLADFIDGSINGAVADLTRIADGIVLARWLRPRPTRTSILLLAQQDDDPRGYRQTLNDSGSGCSARWIPTESDPRRPRWRPTRRWSRSSRRRSRRHPRAGVAQRSLLPPRLLRGRHHPRRPGCVAGERTDRRGPRFLSLGPMRAKLVRDGQEAAGQGGGFLSYVVDRQGQLLFASDPSAFPSKDLSKIDLVREFMAQPVRLTKSYRRGDGPGARRVLERSPRSPRRTGASSSRRRRRAPSLPSRR